MLASAAEPAPHPREFWRQIVKNEYKLPEGESAAALVQELSSYLSSTDPELRDAFGYEITSTWIYRDRAFSPAELRVLLEAWEKNLSKGVGETGTDSVFLRSFSALNLSVIAALDNAQPFLTDEEFARLLDSALRYFLAEKETRGYDAVKGWVHPTAHTADLLKFLARSPRLKREDLARIERALVEKVSSSSAVYVFGEEERIARVFLSLLRRKDARPGLIDGWMANLAKDHKALWQTPKLDISRFASVQNQKSVGRSLFVMLAKDPSGEAVDSARKALTDTLPGL
jgi:hypothetical protein